MEKGNDEDDSSKSENSKGATPSSPSRTQKEKIIENSELSWDVLDNIVAKLNFDDQFRFARVCKSWRLSHKSYWRNFMVSRTPLLVQTSFVMESYSLFNIFEQQHELDCCYVNEFSYLWCSNGYMIMEGVASDKLLLLDPLTRRRKKIGMQALEGNFVDVTCNALHAFVKGSEEFIIVGLGHFYESLQIYHSKSSCWVTCSKQGNSSMVVDCVVFQNSIYVITNMANIGVLNLNSSRLKFLSLKNTPRINSFFLKLVSCDGHLLVVDFEPEKRLNVYKIDFSTMVYTKLESLGGLALFYGSTRCYALSNPTKWGYDSNSLYCATGSKEGCKVYSGDKNIQKSILPPRVSAFDHKLIPYCTDWYFLNQRDEVDYSMVE